jgi:signal transduction histidine kinase
LNDYGRAVSEKRLSGLQWEKLRKLPEMLDLRMPSPERQLARIRLMERDIGLPVKFAILVVLFYYFFLSNWFDIVTSTNWKEVDLPHEVVLQMIPPFYLAYLLINGAIATFLVGMYHFSLNALQRFVFFICFVDALFFSALTLVTEGFDSFLYWVFLALIVRNTVSIPSAPRQIALNLCVCAFYLIAGICDFFLEEWQYTYTDDMIRQSLEMQPGNTPFNEGFLLRVLLLLLLTICCYGVQVLLEKQRRAVEESQEFHKRQEQLQATGRLAAEIAHQLKNPLGIINNAAYTLQKTVKEGKTITQQIRIIREEVERSDRIITELMGYARLSEGQVEKLDITEELDRAIDQVFPPGAKYHIAVNRDYGAALPALLAQRGHLSEVFVNLLQNSREALDGRGQIHVSAKYGDNYKIVVRISDDGPGIPKEKIPLIFEPYYTTKERGTGLGLAIVKHNTELYNGTVEVQSETGKGTTFVVSLPAKTIFNLRQ